VSSVHIPAQLREALEGSAEEDAVLRLAKAVDGVLTDNELPFFPAYTDHGAEHVNQVMEAAIQLTPDGLWSKTLGATDAAVLVSACLLHDIAMHIRTPGFVELVSSDTRYVPIVWFGEDHSGRAKDLTWPALWEAFQREARQFGTSRLELIVGPGADGVPPVAYETSLDPSNWTEADRLLVGEFLRRHHARLSHEIAVYGFPALPSEIFPALAVDHPELGGVAGVVARSHGESLRTFLEYLDWLVPGSKRPRGAYVTFHMALLRVADFLQLDARRAPPLLLRLKAPLSRLSVEEWDKHGAVSSVSRVADDPQAVYVEVRSDHGLRTHMALRELISGLQAELDSTTAILSTEYTGNLAPLRLSVQRVTSNLDAPSMHRQLPYIPSHAGLRSDDDLFRLVIRDLYGNQPAVAGRELVQNSVDAVRARREWERRRGKTVASTDLRDLTADVVVELTQQGDNCELSVADRGIGMTPGVVIDYFLRAGASFSPKKYEIEELDPRESVGAMRAGRFGIGAFAAFILGSEMTVVTRHPDEPRGVEFCARLDEELVELRWANAKIGTKISIPFSALSMPAARYSDGEPQTPAHMLQAIVSFYRLRAPVVKYFINGRPISAPGDVPVPDRPPPPAWRRVKVAACDTVLWRVPSGDRWRDEAFGSFDGGMIAHNGILLQEPDSSLTERDAFDWSDQDMAELLFRPNLAVFDTDHELSVALDRFGLSERVLPFEDELLSSMGTDIVAHALVAGPVNHPLQAEKDMSPVFLRQGWLAPLPALLGSYVDGLLLIFWRAPDYSIWSANARFDVKEFLGGSSPVPWPAFVARTVIRLLPPSVEDDLDPDDLPEGFPRPAVNGNVERWCEYLGVREVATILMRDVVWQPAATRAATLAEIRSLLQAADETDGIQRMVQVEHALKLAVGLATPRDAGAIVAVTAAEPGGPISAAARNVARPWTELLGAPVARSRSRRAATRASLIARNPALRRLVEKWDRRQAEQQ
jgi:molecular chaperone HtpG